MAVEPSKSSTQPTESEPISRSTADADMTIGKQLRNLLIVVVATVLTVTVFLGFRTQATTVSLNELAEDGTVPLELALANGKPSLVEFYANWCTSCQAMAKDLGELKDNYKDQLNFVMLNVDNSKWLPEMLHYRVDGIPHFVFLDSTGETVASVIGEQPRSIMAANVEALISGDGLPYVQGRGQTSTVEAKPLAPNSRPDDPRSHSSQVVDNPQD
ncbi:MAG: thioredoxin family protein [Thainema sp.]